MVLIVIIYGVKKGVNVYDTFLEGATSSFSMIATLFPTFLAMMLGVNLLIDSGFLSFYSHSSNHY